MAYETPITIKKAIENIRKRQYILPSIQREFVWDTNQIERLFDSLMRDYPINTFLFWKVEKNRIKDFQFYEFLKDYHQKDCKHNNKVDLGNDEDVIAILDGQQRMTSMYVALAGSYASKIPYYRWDSPHAFPKKKLYLNILTKSNDIELDYDFKFLSEEECVSSVNTFWFPVADIMTFNSISDVMSFLMRSGLTDTSKYSQDKGSFALETLTEFYNVIHQKGILSYYLEESEELDKVLQIFIRINSGGTKLSYSDLLLSIATAQWKNRDAREVIHDFVDEINLIGDSFNFNKDFVLKSCLVLADFTDIKFKVDNFTKENMSIIESNWDNVAASVRKSVELVAKLGYNRDNLSATNALIPIAYYIYKNEIVDSILHSTSRDLDRKAIKEWLARVFLKGTFGGTPDAIYPVMRNLINDNNGVFPLKETIAYYKGKRKSISFAEDDIENILNYEYGSTRSYCALTLLYPSLNLNYKFHQDHIHPKSFFTKKKLIELGISEESKREEFTNRYNKLGNLQLLEATQNLEKNDKHFEIWLKQIYPDEFNRDTFLMQNHISNNSLEFVDFIKFYEKRKQAIKSQLMHILNVSERNIDD